MSDQDKELEVQNDDTLAGEIAEQLAKQDSEEADQQTTDTTEETPIEEAEEEATPEGDTDLDTVSEETEDGEPEADEEATEEEETEVDYFALYGLDKKYETPAEALKANAFQEQEIQRLRYEIQQRDQQLQSAQRPLPQDPPTEGADDDDIYTNPEAAMAKRGFVRKDQVETMLDQRLQVDRMNKFIEETPDYQELEPVMSRILQENPAIQAFGPHKAVKTLHTLAKMEVAKHTKPKPKVTVKPSADSSRAVTAGGNKGGTKKTGPVKTDRFGLTPQDYATKPIEEIMNTPGMFGD